jgi:hypothetical protein
MSERACMPWHVNDSESVILLSNTFDTARPVRRRFINSWLECPNCDVMVEFGSSISDIDIQ